LKQAQKAATAKGKSRFSSTKSVPQTMAIDINVQPYEEDGEPIIDINEYINYSPSV
jgi:hypothetical protein